MLTASVGSPGGQLAEITVETVELDHSWCHTVGYVSPMIAATSIGAHLAGRPIATEDVVALLADGARDEAGAEAIAARFADARNLLVIASGADRPAARELAIKVEEALVAAVDDARPRDVPPRPPAGDGRLDRARPDPGGPGRRADRVARARQALAAARVLGLRTAAIIAREVDDELEPSLTPAGRLLVDEAPSLPAPVAALLGTATPLQLLTERLARARGTNPDPIRRDDPRYAESAAAAE